MEFKNNTDHDIQCPVKDLVLDKHAYHISIRVGETREIPDHSKEEALIMGLTEVKAEEPKVEVEAEESSIAKTKVETKKVKEKKRGNK